MKRNNITIKVPPNDDETRKRKSTKDQVRQTRTKRRKPRMMSVVVGNNYCTL